MGERIADRMKRLASESKASSSAPADAAAPKQNIEPQPEAKPKGEKVVQGETLFLKFPSMDHPSVRHMKLVFSMFPGTTQVKMVMADTRKVYATQVLLHKALVEEARETLGQENVVIK